MAYFSASWALAWVSFATRGMASSRIFCAWRCFGQPLDHHLDGDVVVVGVPAIVIGHHGDGGVGDLRFAGELGFDEVGHADDGVAGER